MSLSIYKRLENKEKLLINKIVKFYSKNLISIVIFGSFARFEPSVNSDFDVLIILEKTDKKFRERISEFYNNIDTYIEEGEIDIFISPYILTKDEALKFHPIYLGIVETNRIVYDKKNFFKSILSKVKKLMETGAIERINEESKTYWRIKDEEILSKRLY